MSKEIIEKYLFISETINTFECLSEEQRLEIHNLVQELRRPTPYAKFFRGKITLRQFIDILIVPNGNNMPRERLLEKTTKEYMIGRMKRAEIVEKLKQLTIYRKGLEELIHCEIYYSYPEQVRASIRSQLQDIEDWTQKNKDLKI